MKSNYINDMYFYVMQLSHYVRHNINYLSLHTAEEMISLTIDLMNILQLYLNDFYDDEYDY